MRQFQSLKPIPPRKFPSQQYQELNRHLRKIFIGIIVIVILIGMTFIMTRQLTHHHSIRHVTVTRKVRKPHPKPHQPATVKATPKRGERLLGHWLIKLHYSPTKAPSVLIHYQKMNQDREIQFTKALFKINQGSISFKTKGYRIQKLIQPLK